LSITMLVAIFTVHWQNGWQAIADPSAPFANAQVFASADKLERAQQLLMQYGNYDWLTSSGSLVILNNGIEFAVTYLIMLLALIVMGGGAMSVSMTGLNATLDTLHSHYGVSLFSPNSDIPSSDFHRAVLLGVTVHAPNAYRILEYPMRLTDLLQKSQPLPLIWLYESLDAAS